MDNGILPARQAGNRLPWWRARAARPTVLRHPVVAKAPGPSTVLDSLVPQVWASKSNEGPPIASCDILGSGCAADPPVPSNDQRRPKVCCLLAYRVTSDPAGAGQPHALLTFPIRLGAGWKLPLAFASLADSPDRLVVLLPVFLTAPVAAKHPRRAECESELTDCRP
jgi:hypothetical protein